jgi:hypothetical protein
MTILLFLLIIGCLMGYSVGKYGFQGLAKLSSLHENDFIDVKKVNNEDFTINEH